MPVNLCILFNCKLPKTNRAKDDSVDHMVHALCNFETFYVLDYFTRDYNFGE